MEMNQCLVLIEVSQKQRYIFSSNKLRENIGASIVVAQMTGEVPKIAFTEYVEKSDFKYGQVSQQCKDNPKGYFESCCINNGGGNTIYRFANEEEANTFIKVVSLYILKNYFGVEVFFAKHVEGTSNQLEEKKELYIELERKKSCRRQNFRLHGIGLNEKCPSTALPINIVNDQTSEPEPIKQVAKKYKKMLQDAMNKQSTQKVDTYGKDGFNLEVYTKLAAAELKRDKDSEESTGQDEFFSKYKPTEAKDYIFPHDMEQLGGTKEEKNMIAVITADGNGMGERINNLKKVVEDSDGKIQYFDALKIFSEYIDKVYTEAIKDVVAKLFWNRKYLSTFLTQTKDSEENKGIIPIRPLICAGDDICLLTDARIGLDVAETLLKAINQKSRDNRETWIREKGEWFANVVPKEGMHASAGVVFCKQKYPFSRAYHLAEDIQKNAKAILRQEIETEDASMLDFYIAMGEINGSISSERDRRNIKKEEKTENPYVVSIQEKESVKENPYAFTHFQDAVNLLHALMEGKLQKKIESICKDRGLTYTKKGRDEKVGKSKIKEFAYYIRQGNEVAKNFISQVPGMQGLPTLPLGVKDGDYSIYLRAIEMLDLYKKIGGDK